MAPWTRVPVKLGVGDTLVDVGVVGLVEVGVVVGADEEDESALGMVLANNFYDVSEYWTLQIQCIDAKILVRKPWTIC